MKTTIKLGRVVVIMGILTNLLFGGGTDNKINIPALVKNGALVIDVRTTDEFSGGHIEGAIHIPYHVISQEIGKHEIDKAKPIIVYCKSGARSAAARKSLEHAGYTNVINGGSLHQMRKLLDQ